MAKLDRKDWPIELQRSEVKGIFVGGCVSRGEGSRFRAKAHAHSHGEHAGWLCFLSARRLECRELVLHELAHILTSEGHTDEWRRELLRLGGTLNYVLDSAGNTILKRYHKLDRRGKHHPDCPCHKPHLWQHTIGRQPALGA